MDGTFSGHHLGVLAVVLATGIAITAWWVLSGRPEQQSVPSVSFGSASPGASVAPETPAASDPSVSASASAVSPSVTGASALGEELIVDVAGKVRRPGIVTLPPGSRVFDALEAAGGVRGDVDLSSLNLARLLVDGEQVRVPAPGEAGTGPGGGVAASGGAGAPGGPGGPGGGGRISLSTADVATLDTLPGIGPVLAQRIVDWRTANGRFTSVDELGEVSGIGEKLLAQVGPLVVP